MTSDIASFIEENKKGTIKSNEELIDEINSLDTESPDYGTCLCQLVYLICTKRPLIVNYVGLDRRTAWFSYIVDNRLPVSSMMMNVIKFLGRKNNSVCDWLLTLYESDYANTRFLVHYLNSLQDADKVPYASVALSTLSKHILSTPLSDIEVLKTLVNMSEEDLVSETTRVSEKVGGLKRISGETNTDCNVYSWLEYGFEHDKPFIRGADAAYDIGGGFCTPYLSRLFKRKMISLDKIDPSIARDNKIKIVLPGDIKLSDYYDELEKQPWKHFDVFTDQIDDGHDSYFITSFGFATSTVSPSRIEGADDFNSDHTTYFAIKSVTDLIAKGKDVYFFFYGRPSTKVFQNKIVSMKFIKKELTYYNIYSDPYSSKNDHNFGLNKQVAYKLRNK